MQDRFSRRSGVHIILMFLAVTSSLPCVCLGGFLAEDSSRFAAYWNLIESGESKAAQDTLVNLGGEGTGCTEQMANFLLAWHASTTGDLASVPVFLDLGVPGSLGDYDLWLRADALNRTGQDMLAETCWVKLAADTESVFSTDALYRLADHAFDKGLLDDCLGYAEAYGHRRAESDDRQHVEFIRAQALAIMGRHSDAADALWQAYVVAPLTGEASRIRTMLDNFPRRFGFTPRKESPDESAQEYAAIEQSRQFALGLERVERELTSTQPQRTEELLHYFKGRFENGLAHHRDAIGTLQAFLLSNPKSDLRCKALFYLGRSAYLTDRDSEAIPALTEAGSQTEDLDMAQKALDLLGALYLDRNRSADAVTVYGQWVAISKGTSSESDCLWKLGRALWDAGRWKDASEAWKKLYDLDENSDYAPGALYWCARAAAKSGQKPDATLRYALLQSRFPYSYYAIIAPVRPDSVVIEQKALACSDLDDLWEQGGEHCKKLALLTALRLPDFALRELPLAQKEMPELGGMSWWKAQHLLWQGKRIAAYRVVITELGTYLRSAGARPTAFYSLAYPLDFDPQIVQLAQQYGLDPYFVFGLICQESHFEEAIVSPAGATGLMQLMPKTAFAVSRSLGIGYATRKLRDPDYNLRLGIAHLAHLFSDFNHDTVLVLAAYNAGPSASQAWAAQFGKGDRDEFVEHIPYRETRLYVKRIIEHVAAYRRLYPDIVSNLPTSDPSPPPSKSHPNHGVHKRRTH